MVGRGVVGIFWDVLYINITQLPTIRNDSGLMELSDVC